MIEIAVRPARAEDADTLLALIDELADYERLPRPHPEARDRLVRDGFGPDPRFRAFMLELGGVPVGYAITLTTYSSFLARPTLFLEDIYVTERARGRGVGRTALRFLAAEAVRLGCGRMEWMVLDWNRVAIDFYESVGAARLAEWYPYRLAGEALERLAASGEDG